MRAGTGLGWVRSWIDVGSEQRLCQRWPRGPDGLARLALTAPAVRCRFGAGELLEVFLEYTGRDGWLCLRMTERLQTALVTRHVEVGPCLSGPTACQAALSTGYKGSQPPLQEQVVFFDDGRHQISIIIVDTISCQACTMGGSVDSI
jgi:hypothetical protein